MPQSKVPLRNTRSHAWLWKIKPLIHKSYKMDARRILFIQVIIKQHPNYLEHSWMFYVQ